MKQSIEQAAKELMCNELFCNSGALKDTLYNSIIKTFEAGAEFRQPEINELKEKLERATKWIDIEEEKPQFGIKLLVMDKKGNVETVIMQLFYTP